MKILFQLIALLVAAIAGAEQYPFQVGYPFKCGKVRSPVLRGIATQTTVKVRCADGTVRHAIFNAVLEGKTGDVPKIDIIEDVGATGGRPPARAMPALDVAMEVSTAIDGKTYQWQAQKLPAHVWFDGPIATSVRYADYTSPDQFRPIFEVTHWHTINKTFIRWIGENGNSEKIAELWLSIKLSVNGEVVYSRSSFPMPRASRWTRTHWIGGAPRQATPRFDLAYLTSTGAVPNYVTTLAPPAAQLTQVYSEWQKAPKDIGDAGNLQKAMGAGGARPELGPLPIWHTLFLYTGDKRMLEAAKGNADLAASFPMHYREGNAAKSFYGRPLSIWDRPTIHLLNITANADRVTVVGDPDIWGWNPDLSHQPDFYSALYLLTGEEWYLEQAIFWGSYSAAYPNGAATKTSCGRGPTGREGGIPGVRCISMRGQGWAMRSRFWLGVFIPDERALEKKYYIQLANDFIVISEGERGINPRPDPLWQWARGIFHAEENNPNHLWEPGNSLFVQEPLDAGKSIAAVSTWEDKIVRHALERGKELGYATQPLIDWHDVGVKGAIAADHRLMATYRTPTVKTDGTPWQWSEMAGAYVAGFDLAANWEAQTRGDHGYGFVALLAGNREALKSPSINSNVKWAILPRN